MQGATRIGRRRLLPVGIATPALAGLLAAVWVARAGSTASFTLALLGLSLICVVMGPIVDALGRALDPEPAGTRDRDRDLLEALGRLLPATAESPGLAALVSERLPQLLRVPTVELLLLDAKGHATQLGCAPKPSAESNPTLDQLLEQLAERDQIAPELLAALGLEAAAPLRSGKELLGALLLGARAAGTAPDAEELALVRIVASQVAITLENSRLLARAQQTAAHHRNILAGIAAGVLVVDPQGRIASFNRAAADALGEKLQSGSGWEPPPALGQALAAVAAKGGRENGEFQLERFDPPRLLTYHIAPLLGARDQDPLGFQILLEDITEQRLLESRASVDSRLWSVGQLATAVIHDVKNAGFGIDTALRRLSRAAGFSAAERGLVSAARGHLAQVQNLVVAPLNFLRLGEPLYEQVEVVNLVRACFGSVRLEGIELSLDVSEQKIRAEVDPQQLRMLLTHLLENSVAALNGRGSLRLEARVDHRAAQLILKLSDNGPGFPGEPLARLIDPFVSYRPGRPGLGLTVARQIVERHAGTIHLSNPERGGACVRIRLPLVAARP